MKKMIGIDQLMELVRRKDTSVAPVYHSLPEKLKRKMSAGMDSYEARLLTNALKSAKEKLLIETDKKIIKLSRTSFHTPIYLIDETVLRDNMLMLKYVKDRTGCRIFHALKAYATFATFPMMNKYLDGVCASGLNEARLGREEFGKEVHTFAAAYRKDDFNSTLKYSDSIIFNSFYQLKTFGPLARKNNRQIGLRVNPGYAEVSIDMYNPCTPASRLGVTSDKFYKEFDRHRKLIDGLHFHALCEQGADVLERVLNSFERLFGRYIGGLQWVNFGGGHHITGLNYDVELLIKLINEFKKKYNVQVYLEPGEASVLNAGFLISTVLDVVENQCRTAILDTSAEAHMPDVLLMPYRPNVVNSGLAGEKEHTYRLAGPTCLAGDVIGEYSFDRPLKRGDRLVFTDMALYSIVKNTTFNGIDLPSIGIVDSVGKIRVARRFGYEDYRNRQS